MHRILLLLLIAALLVGCAPKAVRDNARGNRLYDEGAYQEALDSYGLAQVDQPDAAEPYYNAANAHNRTGNWDAAIAQTEQALKTADDALAADAWYNLGNAHFDAQDWEQAVAAYIEALRLSPNDADAKHNLELALANLQEQQAQEQNDSSDQEDEESEPNEDGEGSEQERESEGGQPSPSGTPTPQEDGQSFSGEEATPTPELAQAAKPQETPDAQLSPEQAIQLLQALIGDSQTLQERLQDATPMPGAAVEMDW